MSPSVPLFPLYDFKACIGTTMSCSMVLQIGKKDKFRIEQVTTAQRGSRGITLLFL
jgi:hypothetical protein